MDPPELDKHQPVTTHRTLTGARYAQNGHLFTLGCKYIGPDTSYVPPETYEEIIEPPPDEGRAGVLARASARLAEYSEPEDIMKGEKSKVEAAEQLAV